MFDGTVAGALKLGLYSAHRRLIGARHGGPGHQNREGVFSSSGDQLARVRVSPAVVGQLVPQAPPPRFSLRSTLSSAYASVFNVIFPSDCRICGEVLTNVARLPVCSDCIAGIKAIAGSSARFAASASLMLLTPFPKPSACFAAAPGFHSRKPWLMALTTARYAA